MKFDLNENCSTKTQIFQIQDGGRTPYLKNHVRHDFITDSLIFLKKFKIAESRYIERRYIAVFQSKMIRYF